MNRLIYNIGEAIRLAYEGNCSVACPHCGQEKVLPVLPLSPIFVCLCTKCDEYVLPFAGQLLPLTKSVFENGTEEDKKFEIVQAIQGMLYACVRLLVKQKVAEPGEIEDIPDGM